MQVCHNPIEHRVTFGTQKNLMYQSVNPKYDICDFKKYTQGSESCKVGHI